MNCSLLPVLFHTSSFSISFLSLLILLCFFCQLCYVRRISKLETWAGAGKAHLQLVNDSCRVLGSLTGMWKLSSSAGQQREDFGVHLTSSVEHSQCTWLFAAWCAAVRIQHMSMQAFMLPFRRKSQHRHADPELFGASTRLRHVGSPATNTCGSAAIWITGS